MKQALKYSLKVWLTVAIATPLIIFPIIIWLTASKAEDPYTETAIFIAASIILGLVYSIPLLIVMLYITKWLLKREWPIKKLKVTITLVSEALIFILFVSMDLYKHNTPDTDTLSLAIPYALGTGLAIWLYSLKPF